MSKNCHCGSEQVFETCCEPYLKGVEKPQTAEQLMRSRYTAYVVQDEQYLIDTWHSKTRPSRKQVVDGKTKWHRLKIKETLKGGISDNAGEVVFEAIYKINGKAHKHIERSTFEKEEGEWRYLDVRA